MTELTRINESVHVSCLIICLKEEDVDAVVLNKHAATVEGSIGTTQSRVKMADDCLASEHFVLQEYTNL